MSFSCNNPGVFYIFDWSFVSMKHDTLRNLSVQEEKGIHAFSMPQKNSSYNLKKYANGKPFGKIIKAYFFSWLQKPLSKWTHKVSNIYGVNKKKKIQIWN